MSPRFTSDEVGVEVPATSANLGPGFDSFGLALGLCDLVRARVLPAGLTIAASGQGEATIPDDETHLVVRAMRAGFDRLGGQPPGLALTCVNRIPHGRGLGSSAAAIVGGLSLARELVIGGTEQLDDAELVALATDLEGHPDNVAACVLGGLTIAWMQDGVGRAVRVEPTGVLPLLLVAVAESSTHAARAALPAEVPYADAVFNVSRAALLIAALTGAPDHLLTATQDRLHQNYRAGGIPESTRVIDSLRQRGIAAVVSGAGSSVLALCRDDEQAARCQEIAPPGWSVLRPGIGRGARRVSGHAPR